MLGPVETVAEIDSTNAELLRREADGAPHGLVLVARHQTAGRGRRDRRWTAPPGSSLLVSVLLRPALGPDDVHLLTAAAGLAALEACAAAGVVGVSLKWPNDVVVETPAGTRKLAGLLAESRVVGGAISAVVVGMGLNLEWPTVVPDGGTSVAELVGGPVDAERVLHDWLVVFDRLLGGLAGADGRAAVRAAHAAACSTIGREVRVETGDGVVTGVADAIDEHGRLVVLTPSGPRSLSVGDVVHVRRVSGS